ncbi:MAG: hypothetical protein FWF55_09190 [Treponema sp.]|nr:hypothetical protein [Treponema sp.]
MKKLIAIAVVFALVAGAAFAETSVSGSLSVRARLLQDTITDADGIHAVTNGEVETAYIQLSGQNDEGTFGALARLRGNDGTSKFHRVFAWWKPIPQLNIWLGQDPDGKFGPYNAWSFYQGQESYAHDHDWDAWRAAFPGNWDTFGAAISIYPVQGLEFNLVVPIGGVGVGNGVNGLASWEPTYGNKPLDDLFLGSLQLAAVYAIPDIGRVFLNLLGPGENIFDPNDIGGDSETDNKLKNPHYGRFGLAFLLTAVEGLDVQLGLSTFIPGEAEDQPLAFSLIANYNSGDFGLRFRSRFFINSAAAPGQGYNFGNYEEDAFQVGADIQPFYNLGVLKAFLNIGFISHTPGNKDLDPTNQFILNPYIRKGVGPGDIRIGLLLKDPNLDNDNDMQVSIPVQFTYSF